MATLLLGIGNPWASDDGVGPEVVRRVQARWQDEDVKQAQRIDFKTMAQPDLALLDLLPGYNALLVVDAVVSGAPPGTLHYEVLRSGVLERRGVERASSHGYGVREILEMAEVMAKLPGHVELWGIEIASTEVGEGLTEKVEASMSEIISRLINRLRTLKPGESFS